MSARPKGRPGRPPKRQTDGTYPDLLCSDALGGGKVTIFRNLADKPFGERDAYSISAEWSSPSDIAAAYTVAEDEERRLAARHRFAWHPDFGYLSPFPAHCGTGVRIEAEVHLEGLHIIGDLPQVLSGLVAMRIDYQSVEMDGIRNVAHLFRISNGSSIGLPERALAILRNARLLSPGEYIDLLSPVRLASIMGFLDGISREEIDKIMRRNLEKPQQTPPATQEEERQRDNRDADFADRVSAFFAKVRLNDFARETFS